MNTTIRDAGYDQLLEWLKRTRAEGKRISPGDYSMRALIPKLRVLLRRPQLKHSWIAKVEQGERRLDVLEYVAYCLAIGADPHEGIRKVVEHLKRTANGVVSYPETFEGLVNWGKVAEQAVENAEGPRE